MDTGVLVLFLGFTCATYGVAVYDSAETPRQFRCGVAAWVGGALLMVGAIAAQLGVLVVR